MINVKLLGSVVPEEVHLGGGGVGMLLPNMNLPIAGVTGPKTTLKLAELVVLPCKIYFRKGLVCFMQVSDYQQFIANDALIQLLVLEVVLRQSGVAADRTSWRVKRFGSLMGLASASEQ